MRLNPSDRTNIPCREGGELHRHVRGQSWCADCGVLIIARGQFIRAAAIGR